MGKSEGVSQTSELPTPAHVGRCGLGPGVGASAGNIVRWLRTVFSFFGLLLAACPADHETPPVVLKPPEWQDGETSVYDIIRNDSVLYRLTSQVRFDEELLQPAGSSRSVVPTIRLITVVETVSADEYFADSAVVVMRRDNLEPLRSARVLETAIAVFDLEAEYAPGRVTVTKRSIDGTQMQVLPIPPRAYDNEMISFVLRALPLVPATALSFATVVPMDMRVLPVKVKVLGTKVVTTGLGDIMCREVSLTMQRRQTRFWYELAEPHRLAGLANPESKTELRLVSYQASSTATDTVR